VAEGLVCAGVAIAALNASDEDSIRAKEQRRNRDMLGVKTSAFCSNSFSSTV